MRMTQKLISVLLSAGLALNAASLTGAMAAGKNVFAPKTASAKVVDTAAIPTPAPKNAWAYATETDAPTHDWITPTDAYCYPDVDGDGDVTVQDARLALRLTVGLESPDNETLNWMAADADGDGMVTTADARRIYRLAIGLPIGEDDPEECSLDTSVSARMEFDVGGYTDGRITIGLRLVDCEGLTSGFLRFDHDEKAEAVGKKRGIDAKNIGDIENYFFSELNNTADSALLGFYFRNSLWTTDQWANADYADPEMPVCGENFECVNIIFDVNESTDVHCTGELTFGQATLQVDEIIHLSVSNVVEQGECGMVDEENGLDGSQVTWELDQDGVLTIRGNGTMRDYDLLESPWANRYDIKTAVIDDGVTSIGRSAFSYCNGLKSIHIPGSVTEIGGYAFYECPQLTKVSMADGVERIRYCAFKDCTGLTEINIPSSVTDINMNVFCWCSNMTSITVAEDNPRYTSVNNCLIEKETQTLIAGCQTSVIPNDGSVTIIGNSAFEGCSRLTEIVIPDRITKLEYSAFWYCSGLTDISISDSVTFINENVFSNCRNITKITVAENNPCYSSVGNCLIEKETQTLIRGCRTSVIPDDGSVTCIGKGAFDGCTGLTEIVIPDGITKIDDGAFWDCPDLTDVSVPDSVTEVGTMPFLSTPWYENQPEGVLYVSKVACWYKGEMPENTSLTLADGTTGIASNAFAYCDRLMEITIPDSVTYIGHDAFWDCTGLTAVTIPDRVEEIGGNAFPNTTVIRCAASSYAEHWANENGNPVVTIPSPVPVDPSIVASGECGVIDEENGLDGSQVTWKLDKDGVLTISGNGDMRDYDLGTVSPWVTRDDIKAAVIEDGVTNIGSLALFCCSSLQSVQIPASVTNIGQYAFYDAEELKEVSMAEGVKRIEDSAFSNCSGLVKLSIPASVESIDAAAFRNCTGLVEISIPASVTSIAGNIFSGCSGLTRITVEEKNPSYSAAGNCLIEKDTHTLIAGCQTSVIPADGSVTGIGDSAFYNCTGLTEIVISDGVTAIGDEVFYNCTGLTEIVIPDGVTAIGDRAFYYCTGLTEIVIPDSVTTIGDGAFDNCTGLTEIVIPDGVTGISDFAFNNCTGLTEIVIPDGVEYIRSWAFAGCAGLTEITVPDSVIGIGYNSIPETTLVRCHVGSYTDRWAWETNHKVVLICKEHTWGKRTVLKEATCTEDGEALLTCMVCGEQRKEEIPAAPHTPGVAVIENQTPATCVVAATYDSVVYCAVCGAELSRETKTGKLFDHTPGKPVTENEAPATCAKKGSYDKVVYCAVCGAEISRETKVSDNQPAHEWKEIIDQPADCGRDGVKHEECAVCHEKKNEGTVIPATGAHTFGEWTVTTPATAAREGEKTRTCAVCGKTESESIPKTLPADATPTDATPSDATPTDATPTDANPTKVTLGDVDGDGEITSADARLALRRSVNLESFAEDSAAYLASDADGNGTVTPADARLILRASVKLEDPSEWRK